MYSCKGLIAMAQLNQYPPDALINRLSRLGNRINDIAPKMLDAGSAPLERKIKANAERHKKSGELVKSIKRVKPKQDKNGVWKQRIEFKGYDKKRKSTPSDPRGVPNARKALAIEYGNVNEPAKPFIRPAVIQTQNESTAAMQVVFNREVDRI